MKNLLDQEQRQLISKSVHAFLNLTVLANYKMFYRRPEIAKIYGFIDFR